MLTLLNAHRNVKIKKKITSNNFSGGCDPFFLSNSTKYFITTTSTEATALGELRLMKADSYCCWPQRWIFLTKKDIDNADVKFVVRLVIVVIDPSKLALFLVPVVSFLQNKTVFCKSKNSFVIQVSSERMLFLVDGGGQAHDDHPAATAESGLLETVPTKAAVMFLLLLRLFWTTGSTALTISMSGLVMASWPSLAQWSFHYGLLPLLQKQPHLFSKTVGFFSPSVYHCVLCIIFRPVLFQSDASRPKYLYSIHYYL